MKNDSITKSPGQNKTPAFLSQLNLDLINKLYKQNKELQKDGQEKDKTETKTTSQPITVTQFSRIRDEYDPARPNDYEDVLVEREKMRKKEEDERMKELERLRAIEEQARGNSNWSGFKFVVSRVEKPEGLEIEPEIVPEVAVDEEEEVSTEEKVLRMLEKQGWKMGEGNFIVKTSHNNRIGKTWTRNDDSVDC
mgnify:CR=1 FL=1